MAVSGDTPMPAWKRSKVGGERRSGDTAAPCEDPGRPQQEEPGLSDPGLESAFNRHCSFTDSAAESVSTEWAAAGGDEPALYLDTGTYAQELAHPVDGHTSSRSDASGGGAGGLPRLCRVDISARLAHLDLDLAAAGVVKAGTSTEVQQMFLRSRVANAFLLETADSPFATFLPVSVEDALVCARAAAAAPPSRHGACEAGGSVPASTATWPPAGVRDVGRDVPGNTSQRVRSSSGSDRIASQLQALQAASVRHDSMDGTIAFPTGCLDMGRW